jgi:hypothetical protein
MNKQFVSCLAFTFSMTFPVTTWAVPSYSPSGKYEMFAKKRGPKLGPGSKRPGRNGCETDYVNWVDSFGIVGVVPQSRDVDPPGGGLTSSAQPTIWVYVPYSLKEYSNLKLSAQILVKEVNSAQNSFYQKMDLSPGAIVTTPGIVPVKIERPLKSNTLYEWVFKLSCPYSDPTDRPFDSGLIVYTPNSSLILKISSLPMLAQVEEYAKQGYWYDAINLIAPHRRNEESMGSWNTILSNAGLGMLVGK